MRSWEAGVSTDGRGSRHAYAVAPHRQGRVVKGLFTWPRDVVRALERLAAESIPHDEISVFVLDHLGEPGRPIEIPEDPGSLPGAVWGAVVGATVGVGLVVLAVVGAFGMDVASLWPTPFLGAVGVVWAAAAVGVPIGAAIAFGRGPSGPRLSPSIFEGAAVLIVVESAELADVARRVLRASGADDVGD